MRLPLQRILLVEDNEDDYVIIRDLLKDVRTVVAEVEWVSTYEAAYTAFTQGQYDVCLLDYQLGGHNGLEIFQALPAANLPPIILLTGNEDYHIDVAATQAGASDYLLKGHINAPLLERAIRYAIQRRKTEAALLHAQRFAQATVDALPDHIAVLDEQGTIVAVNAAWREFASDNGYVGADYGLGDNYSAVCDSDDSEESRSTSTGIREVMAGERDLFALEYPCHSSNEERWYEVRVRRFASSGPLHVVVAHENITQRKLAEAARFERAQEFETLVENAPDIVSRYDRKFRHLYVNRVVAQATGLPASAFTGKTHEEMGMPRHLQAEWHALLEEVFVSGQEREIEFEFPTPGGPRFYLSRLVPEYAPDGRILSVLNIARDITQRKQAETDLRESNEKFFQLANNIEDVFWTRSPNMSELQYLSPAFERVWGRSIESLYANPQQWNEFIVPEDRERVLETFSKLQRDAPSVSCEYRIVRPNGGICWVHTRGFQVHNDAGELIRLTGVSSDITERKEAELALRESEERFRAVFEQAAVGICIVALDYRFQRVNERFCEIVGYSADELSRDNCVNTTHPDDQAGDAEAVSRLLAGEESVTLEKRYIRKDKRVVWARLTLSLMRSGLGEPQRFIGVISDITERKEAELALHISEERFRQISGQLSKVLDSSLDAICTFDGQGRFVQVSAACEQIWGYQPEELIGTPYIEKVLPEDQPLTIQAAIDIMAGQGTTDFENRYVRKDGSIAHIIWSARWSDAERSMFCVARDNTKAYYAREALRESEARFSSAFEHAPIGMALVGLDGRWLQVNRGLCDVVGYSEAELLTRTFQEITHPDDLEADLENVQHLLAGETRFYHMEKRYFHADGHLVTVSLNVSFVRDSEEQPLYFIAQIQDITERKRTEEALRRSEALFRTIINSSWDAFQLVEPSGQIIYESPAVTRLLGYQPEEMVGRNAIEFVHPDDVETIMAGGMELMDSPGAMRTVQLRVRHKNGSWRWVESFETNLLDNTDVGAVAVNYHDITERKQAEDALRESEHELRTVIEAMPQIVWVTRPDGWHIDFNQRWLDYTGLTMEESLGFGWNPPFHPEDRPRAAKIWKQATESGEPYNIEYRLRRADGVYRWMLGRALPLRDVTGTIVKWFGTCTDIHDLKQAELEIARSNQEQRELAAHLELERTRLVTAQSVAKVGSWELDVVTHALTWSDEVFRIFGIEKSQFGASYEAFLELLDPADRAAVHETYTESVSNRTPFVIEHRIETSEGSLKIVQERCQTYYDDAGRPVRSVGTVQDITERKQAETALQVSQQRLALATEGAQIGIWDWDVVTNALAWDAQMYALYGIREEDFSGAYEAWSHGLHPEDRERSEAELKAALEDEGGFHTQFRVIWPDATVRHVEAHAIVVRADDGTPQNMIGVNYDITERKAAAEIIGRLAAIVQSSDDSIVSKTLEGVITSWNPRAESFYGYSAEEVIGRHASILMAPDRPEEESQLLARIARGESIAQYETARVRKDGSTFDVSLTLSPIRNEIGVIIGAASIARDITERKQAEKALRASEQRLRSFMENTPARVFIKDREGHYVFLNKAIEQFRKIPIGELEGQTVFDNFSLAIAEPLHRNDLQVFTSGEPQQFEEVITAPDGQLHYEIVSKFILPDADGRQLLAGIAVDVTEQRKAEQQRDRFFSMSLDMLCISGFDGYFRRVNPAFTLALGHTEKELLSLPFINYVHPDDVDASQEAVEKLAKGGVLVGFENRYRHKDGTWHWLAWKAISEVNEGLIYAAAHDITDQKAHQAALLKMRDDLEVRVAERTQELIETNVMLAAQVEDREKAERAVRVQARQQEVVAELGQQALGGAEINTLFNGGIALLSATLQADVSSILELLPDGESLLIRAGVGVPAEAIGQATISAAPDTMAGHALSTGKPLLVKNLREETRFAPAPLALAQGVISSVNVLIPNGDKPFGLICCGSTKGRLFNQDDVHFLQAVANVLSVAITRAKVEQEIIELNTELQARNEELRTENIEHQMTMGILRTTAESLQKATEEADRANLAKSEFLSRMSHELRTPLNAILGFGQILERENLDELAQESLGYILKGGRHLLDLINEILDIARVEAGRVDLSLEPIALDDMVLDVCSLVLPLAQERAIRLKNNGADLAGTYVLADHQRLKQVLINLLSNAIKYNREGGEVEVRCQRKADGRITIAVQDTGPGISPQNLSKLFTPFERLDADKSEVEGTGLGLTLSERLVTAMNGTLSVESTLGRGTTFCIELPPATSPEESLTTIPQGIIAQEPSQVSEHTYSLLCIEDNPSNLRLIETILRRRPDITLLTAIQGSVGLDLARQHEPDLILLDLNLPDIHGSEVLTRLQQSALTREIPVVIVSADATSKQIEKLITAGARDYLTKPFDVSKFLQVLDKFLETKPETAM